MTVLEELIRIGFEPITEWVMKGDKIALRTLDWKQNGGWLYAFVVNDEVRYIGLTNRVLRSRMDDYRDQKSSQTMRLREAISAELNDGRRRDTWLEGI